MVQKIIPVKSLLNERTLFYFHWINDIRLVSDIFIPTVVIIKVLFRKYLIFHWMPESVGENLAYTNVHNLLSAFICFQSPITFKLLRDRRRERFKEFTAPKKALIFSICYSAEPSHEFIRILPDSLTCNTCWLGSNWLDESTRYLAGFHQNLIG